MRAPRHARPSLDSTITTARPLGAGAHSAPWLLARLVAAIDADSNLGSELRSAIGPDGVRDRSRLSLTLLAAMKHASRSGCDQEQIRSFVDFFVRSGASDRRVEERCAERAQAMVDALVLRSAAPSTVLATHA